MCAKLDWENEWIDWHESVKIDFREWRLSKNELECFLLGEFEKCRE